MTVQKLCRTMAQLFSFLSCQNRAETRLFFEHMDENVRNDAK